MELNKTNQDLKMEVKMMEKQKQKQTNKQTKTEITLEIETQGKKSGIIDVSISNRIQEMEERISGAEYIIENVDTIVKENSKCKNILTQNI
jgi:hypothetical protein